MMTSSGSSVQRENCIAVQQGQAQSTEVVAGLNININGITSTASGQEQKENIAVQLPLLLFYSGKQ